MVLGLRAIVRRIAWASQDLEQKFQSIETKESSQQLPQVESTSTQQRVELIAHATLQPVALRPMIRLQVPYHRLNRRAPTIQLPRDVLATLTLQPNS